MEYLCKLRSLYDGMLIYGSKDSYTDAIFKGKIQGINEVILLEEAIRESLKKREVPN